MMPKLELPIWVTGAVRESRADAEVSRVLMRDAARSTNARSKSLIPEFMATFAFWHQLAEPLSQSLPAIAAPRAGSTKPA